MICLLKKKIEKIIRSLSVVGWSEAYHYHLDTSISVDEAIKLQKGEDPRAGDLHCHKSASSPNADLDYLLGKRELMGEGPILQDGLAFTPEIILIVDTKLLQILKGSRWIMPIFIPTLKPF